MIKFIDWLEVVNYRITEGSEYLWNSYGSNAYRLEYWDRQYDGVSSEIIYDTVTQRVFEVTVHDTKNERCYRWINPLYINDVKAEAESRDVDHNQAWDDVEYTDLELDYDWIEKATAIINYEEYDTRVQIELNLPEHELNALFKEAHKKDMTFNEYVEYAIERALEEYKDGR